MRCMMAIHAHPDDECFQAGSWVRYRREGVKTVLITCTLGEEGEIHDPDLDQEEAKPRLGQIRERELRCSAQELGLSELVLLRYRDSGMAGTPSNQHPDAFTNANFEAALERVVELVRRHRPEVLFSYDENGGYGHPDHIMAHRLAVAAFEVANDPGRFPASGEAWQPLKLYYVAIPRSYFTRVRAYLKEQGKPDPFEQREREAREKAAAEGKSFDEVPRQGFGRADEDITTRVLVPDTYAQKIASLRCHRTQMSSDGIWFTLPREEAEQLFGQEYYILAQSHVQTTLPEDDLFAGLP
jgi:mycothiol conjugate amidase Mca